MSKVLDNIKAASEDVLLVEHRASEPFDAVINPADLDAIKFNVGQVAAVNAQGYVVRADKDDIPTTKVIGLFCLPSTPTDARKNNYVLASGNASILSAGIVRLSHQISDAAISATDVLYVGEDGQLTKTKPAGPTTVKAVGIALSSRTEAGAFVRVKLEL